MRNLRILLLAAACLPGTAMAQAVTDRDEPSPDAGFGTGNAIIVTAQRRSERVQDIPASITAIGGETLTAAGVADITNVSELVPGFYAKGFGASRPQLYIRGIGTRQFDPGSESSVGVFVDDSYLGRTGGVLGSLKDIERVEVLKGPQGTLYGRNTIGGAVNVITKGPTDYFSAEAEASYGNYDFYEIFGAVSGPIAGDLLKGRIAGWHTKRDGYITNLTTGNNAQGLDNWGGRLRFEVNPTDTIQIDLIGEILRDDGPSFQGESVGNPADPTNTLLGNNAEDPTPGTGPYRQFYTTDPAYNRDIEAFTGKIDWNLGAASLVSITSYRELSYTDDRDFDNTDLDVIRQISDETSEQFSQEFRLISDSEGPLSLNGFVDWIVGVYYYDDKSFHSDTFDYGENSVIGEGEEDTTFGRYKTTSVAAFGQATFHLADVFDLTLGARYTEDEKQSTLGGISSDARPLVGADFLVENPEVKFTSFDPKVTLAYKPNRDLNIYASYSQGFKSGGYQYTPLTAAQAASVFEPERIDAYEVGFKSTFGNGEFQLNGAAFYYDYQNLQVSTVVDLGGGNTPSLIANAASSEIKGAEFDATMRPSEYITFNLAYAYTDAKYENYEGPGGADFSGTRLVRAPEHSINLSGQWEIPFGPDRDLTLRADYSLISDFFHEPGEGRAIFGSNIPRTEEDGYGLLNLRATANIDDFYVSVWGKNVTNELYRRTVLALPGQLINFYGEPRFYGATVGFRY